MTNNNNKLIVLVALTAISFCGAAFSLLNFIAAINIGYDLTPQGKQIISNWCYAMIGLMIIGCLFSVLMFRSWNLRRKQTPNQEDSPTTKPGR